MTTLFRVFLHGRLASTIASKKIEERNSLLICFTTKASFREKKKRKEKSQSSFKQPPWQPPAPIGKWVSERKLEVGR